MSRFSFIAVLSLIAVMAIVVGCSDDTAVLEAPQEPTLAPSPTTAPTLAPTPTATETPEQATSPTPAPEPTKPPPEPNESQAEEPVTQNCDTSYPDVCIPIGAADYDCAGGSGNGPNYIRGPLRVLPPDPHGLDRDGDGIGCES